MTDRDVFIRACLIDVLAFCRHGSGRKLRSYQVEVARAIIDSIKYRQGKTFVVVFPRQSGKNELQAQIETYLLLMLSKLDTEMVKASPTWKPQSLNAMRRLERVLSRNVLTRGRWEKESGYVYRLRSARIYFLSGEPTANVVGATANVLLECDEAQDILPGKWDKDFAPMAASTNATRVFWGTAWTSRSLLARERRAAEAQQAIDGQRRVWVLTAEQVGTEVPAYKAFVSEQVAKLGRNHPMIRTQFFSEEIDSEGGMFPPERVQLMRGAHPRLDIPDPNKLYAMTIDVAGVDETVEEAVGELQLEESRRDSTAVTVFEVDLSTLPANKKGAPTYRSVCRYTWVGTPHSRLFNQIRDLAQTWRAQYIVIDSTGVGQGLASFLDKSFPGKVIPFLFTQKSKSDLGWKFLAVIETGRFQEYTLPEDRTFWNEVRYCQSQVLEGPGHTMRWGVPDGTRDELSGGLVHDDTVLSAALCAVLDEQEWAVTGPTLMLAGKDPLADMDSEGY